MKNVLILFLAVAMMSCNSKSKLSGLSSIIQNPWELSELMGNLDFGSLFGDQIPFLNFSGDGKVNGSDGCNNLMGNVGTDILNEGKLDLSQLASTQMACPQDGPDLFNQMLGQVKGFNITDGLLNLTDEVGNKLAAFKPKATAE